MSEFRLPRIPKGFRIVDPKTGLVAETFRLWWQSLVVKLEAQETAQDDLLAEIADILDITDDLDAAVDAVEAAVIVAEAAADAAQASADDANSVASLTGSGVTPNPLSATDAGADATIIVDAHTRVYGDGATLAIAGPVNLTGRAYSTTYFVYYDDPTRADTTPSYQTTTSEATAAQTGDRHLVGMVLTPAAAAPDNDGDHVRPPGVGGILP